MPVREIACQRVRPQARIRRPLGGLNELLRYKSLAKREDRSRFP